ncbi:MAG: glycosyltransferase, partial [Pauljensenia sp.]
MRIAFVVNSYPPRLGGLESHIYHLSVSLAQLGHRVFVLTISDEPGHRTEETVDVRTDRAHLPIADVISFPSAGATRRIARFLAREHIDIVSVHTRFFPMSFVGVRAAH